MFYDHCSLSELDRMGMDDCEVESRFLDAWLEAKAKPTPKR